MKVHHLNCGTMRPPGAAVVCHVLLIETDDGLVLVDSGYGLADLADPGKRLGGTRHLMRPALDPAETAVRQVEQLGFTAADVRHILLTHLDADHAGGIADFPDAQVHTTAAEWTAARNPATAIERARYRPVVWAHGPRVVTHEPQGEAWRGFPAARPLDEVAPGIAMIALPGHTRGHAAYAVELDDRTVLHAGDAFYHHSIVDGQGRQPALLTVMERLVAHDFAQVQDNHARLAELHRDPTTGVTVVSAHDPDLLAEVRSAAGAP
ncbi:MBL fold metallo-hydrolase [Pseudonocardia sp. CA-107938]|uniref:MBL fold metallo-hydrolase n=1 Tax=Pseudonocardia sp. CA-107938 TaxID=3240021 RepID=UPI003D8AAFD2